MRCTFVLPFHRIITAGPKVQLPHCLCPKEILVIPKETIDSHLLKSGHIGPKLSKTDQPIDFEKNNWKSWEKPNLKFYIQLYITFKKKTPSTATLWQIYMHICVHRCWCCMHIQSLEWPHQIKLWSVSPTVHKDIVM